MIWLYILASPVLFLLGFLLILLGFIFYPFHEGMLDVVAWLAAKQ